VTQDKRHEVLARLLEARVRGVSEPSMPELSEEERDYLDSLMDVANLLWDAGHSAPALESDPVAAMLGLLPDPRCALDPKALVRARKAAGLKPSDLAARLTVRGWDVQARDIFRWETRSAADVAPALIRAIADETGANVDRLTTSNDSAAEHTSVAAVTKTSRFQWLVERWARVQGISPALAASALESRMWATVHRGDHPDAEQLLQSLDALVAAIEAGDEQRSEP
jgi:hypothetical protein